MESTVVHPGLALGVALVLGLTTYFLFRPGRGAVSRWRRASKLGARVRREDALKHIHRGEMEGEHPGLNSLAGALQLSSDQVAQLLSGMQADDLVSIEGSQVRLTPLGRQAALHILRAHRLWESHLAVETGYPAEDWHDQAEEAEHRLTPDELRLLEARLGFPERDPHGDPIPTLSGDVVRHGGLPLTTAAVDVPLQIVHLEDEPEVVFAQLAAERLHPGMEIRLIERTPQRVRFWAGGDEHVLAPIVANNIAVLPLAVPAAATTPAATLSQLHPGEKARIVRISPAIRGAERRRLLDLGLLPGTEVSAEFTSPGGDPTAYLVRGATLALRADQAERIEIER